MDELPTKSEELREALERALVLADILGETYVGAVIDTALHALLETNPSKTWHR